MNHEKFMALALAEAKKGDSRYGAVIVRDNEVVLKAYNTVIRDSDPSAHAEMNAIRNLTTKNKSSSLAGYTIIYASGEPCLMCAAACIWAGVDEIVIGASIQDLININQSQINLSCEQIIAKSSKNIKVTKGILQQESIALFT
ncbi:MAG: nucleoside deaminase [Chroococcus sp. CMT-3BRIN-NPC107]|jgi:tRNA(Arg) A34 adenosine deaminase TadA|nr:nucleoside deaminase [Chroococcus sp. CMT-3BRIN-NPC107]